jgi:hypothetical protein
MQYSMAVMLVFGCSALCGMAQEKPASTKRRQENEWHADKRQKSCEVSHDYALFIQVKYIQGLAIGVIEEAVKRHLMPYFNRSAEYRSIAFPDNFLSYSGDGGLSLEINFTKRYCRFRTPWGTFPLFRGARENGLGAPFEMLVKKLCQQLHLTFASLENTTLESTTSCKKDKTHVLPHEMAYVRYYCTPLKSWYAGDELHQAAHRVFATQGLMKHMRGSSVLVYSQAPKLDCVLRIETIGSTPVVKVQPIDAHEDRVTKWRSLVSNYSAQARAKVIDLTMLQ